MTDQDPSAHERQVPGDKKAFRDLFRRLYIPLCMFANSKVRNQEAAREIVQELFVHLWEKRKEIIIHTSLTSYLYRSVHHASLNYLKHNSIVERTHIHIAESSSEQPVQPDAIAEEGELYENLHSALNLLPERTRIIFEKVRFEGKKYREVADELNISVKTVEAHMSDALRFLRNALRRFLVLLPFLPILFACL